MTEQRLRKRDRTRAQLLDVALELIAAEGYAATTIDQIAVRADVARQTVLNHFPRKDDFVRAWGERRRDQVADLLRSVAPEHSARRTLHAVYHALAQINERERELTRALHPYYQVIAAERPIPDVVLAAIRSGQRDGEFNPAVDAVLTAQILTAVYFDALTRWLAEDERPLASMLTQGLDLLFDGLRADRANSP